MTRWCQSLYEGPGEPHAPSIGARCALEVGHAGEHVFARREPLPELPEAETVPPYQTEHKPRFGYRHGMPCTVECSCGIRFTRQDTDTEYVWHLAAVQADLAAKQRRR